MKKTLLTLWAVVACIALYAQPANDNCADAISVTTDEVVDFSTIDATDDGPAHPGCASSGSTPDSLFNDIWFTYTADFTGQALWSLCGTTDFDSKIAVYLPGTTCPPMDADLLICNDDGASPECDIAFASEALFDVVSGETYLLRVGGYGDGGPGEEGTGSFTVTEFVPAVPNDNCSGAIAIGLVEDYMFSNIDATTDGPEHPGDPNGCFGFNDPQAGSDIWYSFTPTASGFVQWSTCSTISFDSRLVVYGPNPSCPPTAEELYSCNDDGQGCTGFSSSLNFGVEAGQTYILRLGGFSGDQGQGTFNLIEIEPPVPPVNDNCAEPEMARIITRDEADAFEVFFEGTTVNGTFTSSNFSYPQCLTNQNGGEFADVWYSFNTLGNTEIELRLNSSTEGAQFYADLFLDCDNQIDTLSFPGACLFTTLAEPFVTTTITGLPSEPIDLLLRVTTRLTSDLPGEFFFQLVGDITSGTNEPSVVEELILFPNPTNGQVVTSFNLLESSDVQISVVNLLGASISSQYLGRLPAGKQVEQTDVSQLPAGIYFLRVMADGKSRTVKFVKE
ncbi:MAG: T9SS type A sorting domain-containing protein [Phaeodactylibacter sp.]|nr:T9SS type A sorting domain-containing protein [Phaeodactylibacter sp.]MCB9050424.1 T9SS type A sorting domain-containing protein [Lewinellaceae bacterium]